MSRRFDASAFLVALIILTTTPALVALDSTGAGALIKHGYGDHAHAQAAPEATTAVLSNRMTAEPEAPVDDAAAAAGAVVSGGCDAGPSVPPAVSGEQLEVGDEAWGGYCEGWSGWSVATGANGLDLSLTGGDPYANVHFYRHVAFDADDTTYRLAMDFDLPETTLANQGAPSTVQALEFVVSVWDGSYRYEWAIQWTNVGRSAPGWRYWDPSAGWLWLDIDAPLDPGTHRFELSGSVTPRAVELESFTIDGTTHVVGIDVGSAVADDVAPIVAVALQLDGNHAGDPYTVTIRNVTLTSN